MAALSYLALPVTGLIAYLRGRTQRLRFHGLQAIVVGFVWPLVMYLCSLVSPGATQVAFALGAVLWLALLVGAAVGVDMRLPLVGKALYRAAAESPSESVTTG